MDHLSDEYNSFAFPDKIRLICNPSKPSFDTRERCLNDFVDLPQQLGWSIHENGDRLLETGSLDLNAVTQRWLYFEVLAQVFGHLPNYQWEDFTLTDQSGQSYINTVKLPEYIEQWLEREKNSDSVERNRRLIRIQQVLDRARAYVSQHCTVANLQGNPTWEINGLLALSFMVLGETLTRAQNLVQRRVGFSINGWSSLDSRNQGWGYSKIILEKLNRDAWCAKAIYMFQALLRGNTIGLIYLFTFRESSFKGPEHRGCTANECKEKEFRSEPVQYHHCSAENRDFCAEILQARYVESGQTPKHPICTTVGFNGNVEGPTLAAIIDKGKIPLFRFDRSKRRLEVVEMSQSFDKSYAVFSHVWADGFGTFNDRNEMNLCVLNMFSVILEQITLQRAGTGSSMHELFWIDTLAIPVQQTYKTQRAKAITQMHNIYVHAKYTIVLDLGLMQATMGPGYSSPAMKITMSKWMTRLWTLQEAVLSKNLFFYFHDYIYSMSNLEEMFAKEDSKLHSCIPSLSRIYFDGILGDMRPKIHDDFRKHYRWKPSSDFLTVVWKATQWRSTTHLIHETLSLATMLNIDTAFFARPSEFKEETKEYKQECENRMIHLLSCFAAISPCPIPPGMIFLAGPRLTKKGYGWAPRTWLSSREIDSPDPLSLVDAGNTRLIQAEGLEVQFPGFLLHNLGDDREELHRRENFCFSADSTLLDWYRVEPAEDTRHFPEGEKLRERELAIIASRLPIVDLKEIALFVAINRTWGGTHYVEILNRVWISREERQEMLQDWSRKYREGKSEAMSAGERLPSSVKWCVDGPAQRIAIPEELEGEGLPAAVPNGTRNGKTKAEEEEPEPTGWLKSRVKTALGTFKSHEQPRKPGFFSRRKTGMTT